MHADVSIVREKKELLQHVELSTNVIKDLWKWKWKDSDASRRKISVIIPFNCGRTKKFILACACKCVSVNNGGSSLE